MDEQWFVAASTILEYARDIEKVDLDRFSLWYYNGKLEGYVQIQEHSRNGVDSEGLTSSYSTLITFWFECDRER